jgi:hypothetical protein
VVRTALLRSPANSANVFGIIYGVSSIALIMEVLTTGLLIESLIES